MRLQTNILQTRSLNSLSAMGRKSDISDIVRYLESLNNSKMRISAKGLLKLLKKEDCFISMEAIDLNLVLKSTPELSKDQIDRIKKHKRLLRKRIAKKVFEKRSKRKNIEMEIEVKELLQKKEDLRMEKASLENELSLLSRKLCTGGVVIDLTEP